MQAHSNLETAGISMSRVVCLSYWKLDISRFQSKQNDLKTSVMPWKMNNKVKNFENRNDSIELLLEGGNSGFSLVCLRMLHL